MIESIFGNTRVIRANLAEEFLKLKHKPGKKISIGGVSLLSQLIALGLVDGFYFLVHPILAGQGRRLFDEADFMGLLNLKLADSKVLNSGCVAFHYLK